MPISEDVVGAPAWLEAADDDREVIAGMMRLDAITVLWPECIRDRIWLARAFANTYNDVKQYDRGDFPDHHESYV